MDSRKSLSYLSFFSIGNKNQTDACIQTIEKDLDLLEKLEKEINILKYILGVNFDIDLSKDVGNSYRVYISKNNRNDNTILFIGKEEYELLKEILEND